MLQVFVRTAKSAVSVIGSYVVVQLSLDLLERSVNWKLTTRAFSF